MPYTFNSGSLRKLISKATKVEIDRGVISISIENSEGPETVLVLFGSIMITKAYMYEAGIDLLLITKEETE